MRKRTKRKVVTLMNPISLAIEGAGITLQSKLDELRVRELAGIDAFAIGQGYEQAWYDLRTMVLVSREMGLGQVGPEAVPICDKAIVALEQDIMIHPETRVMHATPEALKLLREVFALYDLQRQSISRGEYERYIKKTLTRVRSSTVRTPKQT